MRHRVDKIKLNRDMDHKKALLKNMSASLIENERIETTLPKAKSLRPYIERLVSKARTGNNINTVRYLRKKLFSENAIRKLVTEIGPKYKEQNGGYTRIIKIRNRDGDNSVMAVLEFVIKKKTIETKKVVDAVGSKTKDTKEKTQKKTGSVRNKNSGTEKK